MADKSVTFEVKGLRDFLKELRRLDDKTFTDELKDAHAKVADLVVDKARTAGGLPVQRKAAQSLKASRAASKAQVLYGGPGYAFAFGAEFGSNRYRQFPPHLGRTGYFLYPTIRAESDQILRVYKDAVDDIIKRAFPN